MKLAVALATLLAAVAAADPLGPDTGAEGGIFARTSGECRSRWRYCGKTLLGMGWSRGQIMDRLRNHGEAPWLGGSSVDEVVFGCGKGSELWFISSCNKPGQCVNAGANRDDYCS